MAAVFLNRIATAVPEHDIHRAFVEYAEHMLCDERLRAVFRKMVSRSDVEHRFSPLQVTKPTKAEATDVYHVYVPGNFPSTAQRMKLFERFAPALAARALDRLGLAEEERKRIRHVIVTCCTGLYSPGLDFLVIDHLGLAPSTERTMIGFMGCYAAINGLKQARHIVRSEPRESVLMVNLELCSPHLNLHRKKISYYGFKTLAWAMRWHNFVRHDGPVSILRSFLRADWESYCAAAGLRGCEVEIEEQWPARLCVSRVKR